MAEAPEVAVGVSNWDSAVAYNNASDYRTNGLYRTSNPSSFRSSVARQSDALLSVTAWVTSGWRRSVVVSGVGLINEVNRHWARLVIGWVTAYGRVNGM